MSTGSLPYRAALHAVVRAADAVRGTGTLPEATPYPELQTRLANYASRLAQGLSGGSSGISPGPPRS